MPLQKRDQVWAADLFLTLEEALHVDRQRAARSHMGLDRLDMGEHLSLVVAGATTIQFLVADHRPERWYRPGRQRVDGLHVVMAVDQHGRPPRRMQPVCVNDRVSRRRNHADMLQTDESEVLRQPAGTALHIGRMPRLDADAREADEVPELSNETGFVLSCLVEGRWRRDCAPGTDQGPMWVSLHGGQDG